jgi:site-specific DNA-methyltransferase (adenine-specific)
MDNDNSIETVYTYVDTVATVISKETNQPYLKGVSEAIGFLIDHRLTVPVDLESEKTIETARQSLDSLEFSKETVRKGIQIGLLKGFKELGITNAMMTPDSIGMFISYLVSKLYGGRKPLKVLDPLSGTGNLLATLVNHYDERIDISGIEIDPMLADLSKNLLDALDVETAIATEDTLAYHGESVDLIVTDFPVESIDRKNAYLPYQVILHHMNHVKPGGYFVALIENNFFEQNEADTFKERLMEDAHLYGLLKLDESLFTNHHKSILILKRKTHKEETEEKFLVADLPPFSDETAFNRSLDKIEDWFKNRKVD